MSARPRLPKNSFSWILTRSHGGLPTTQENPPVQPVARVGAAVVGDGEDAGELQVPVEEPVLAGEVVDQRDDGVRAPRRGSRTGRAGWRG